MTPERSEELHGAIALLRSFLPFVERLAPAEAPLIAEGLAVIGEAVNLLQRYGNVDDARAELARRITTDWQAKLRERFGGSGG